MNNQLFLEGHEVDLTDVITIPLNKSFEDLSNPTNINNEFSKTIKLPVSEKNNQILGDIFRLDRVVVSNYGSNKNIGMYLNATKKIKFRLLNNNDLLLEGYAKLSLVDYSVDDKFYTLNLFGTLGDLFHKLLNCCFSTKYAPIMDYTDIIESDDGRTRKKFDYALAFDARGNFIENPVISTDEHLKDYTWRDARYIMSDCLSGLNKVCAKDIAKCWDTNPEMQAYERDVKNIDRQSGSNHKLMDWNIVGFMPTHHGFPNDFDPKSYEHHNEETGYCENKQFVDTANEMNKYDNSSLIGNGLTEEQFQQFVSWQQKPYIYVSALFGLFKKHMEDNPDLFDGYKLEIDPRWEQIDYTAYNPVYKNPYWANLCYTMDFLFNKDTIVHSSDYRVRRMSPDVQYNHISAADDIDEAPDTSNYKSSINQERYKKGKTDTIAIRSNLLIDYGDYDIPTKVKLNGYVCVALPCYNDRVGDKWTAIPKVEDGQVNFNKWEYGYRRIDAQTGDVITYTSNPYMFFSSYFNPDGEDGQKYICNGGYMITIRIYDEVDNLVSQITNSWAPLHLGKIDSYEDKQTRKLINKDGFNFVNGKIIDLCNERDSELAAVVLHRTFKGDEIENGKLRPGSTRYIGMGFPLASFGEIPLGVPNPRIEVTVKLMSERYENTDDIAAYAIDNDFQYNIGCYVDPYVGIIRGSRRQMTFVRHCNLNCEELFPYSKSPIYQQDGKEYITLFYQPYNDSTMSVINYGSSSEDPGVDYWLKTVEPEVGSGMVAQGFRAGWYNSLVASSLVNGDEENNIKAYGADAIIDIGETGINDKVISIGSHREISGNVIFVDNNHSPIVKMENLWNKEDSIFKALIEYSKMFGLFWVVDNANKKLRLLTRLSYFDNYTLENWDNKIDHSKDYQITPILHESKYLNFDYEDEKDATHYTMYGENYDINYGGYKLKTGYDFTPDSEDLFKGIHSTCFSNRPILTWNQIVNYSPSKLPFVTNSPFTMMDADTKDGTKPIEINNWVFRNDSTILFSDEDKASGYYYISKEDDIVKSPCIIIDDTPTMKATGKFMYLDCDRSGNDYYGTGLYGDTNNSGLGVAFPCTTFPNFNIVTTKSLGKNGFGCLFAAPMEDYTIPLVSTEYPGGNLHNIREPESRLNIVGRDGKWIFNYAWRRWMDERYNINNKKLTCYVDLKPIEFSNITPLGGQNDIYFANFKIIDGQIFMLNKIFDYNPLSNETTKCEFIQVSDLGAYKDTTLEESFQGLFEIYLPDEFRRQDGIYRVERGWFDEQFLPTDYFHNKFYNPESYIPLIVYSEPIERSIAYISDSSAYLYKYNGESDPKYSLTWDEKEFNSYNEVYGLIKLKPYFTWFTDTDQGRERIVGISGKNVIGESDSLQIAYKNVRAMFQANANSFVFGYDPQQAVKSQTQFNTWTYTLFNNLGLNVKTVLRSFYEIPILCKKNRTYNDLGEGGEEGSGSIKSQLLKRALNAADAANAAIDVAENALVVARSKGYTGDKLKEVQDKVTDTKDNARDAKNEAGIAQQAANNNDLTLLEDYSNRAVQSSERAVQASRDARILVGLPVADTSGGEGVVEVVNVILPTHNNCIRITDISRDNATMRDFNFVDTVSVESLEMFDSADSVGSNSKGISKIFDEIAEKYGYDRTSMRVLPVPGEQYTYGDTRIPDDYTGALGRARLFTVAIHYLEGCNNYDFNNVSSTGYAYELFAHRDHMLYSGSSNVEAHNGDFSLQQMNEMSTITPLLFGCGDKDRWESVADKSIIDSLSSSQDVGYHSSPVSSAFYYNNPDSVSNNVVPELGNSRILDYLYAKQDLPYLTDYDMGGDDGYCYQVFYQDLHPFRIEKVYNWHLIIYGSHLNLPQTSDGKYYMVETDGLGLQETAYLERTMYYDHYTDTRYGDISVEVIVDYDVAEGQQPYTNSSNIPLYTIIDETAGIFYLNIPENTTGHQRYITFRFRRNNSMMYEDLRFYQAAASN